MADQKLLEQFRPSFYPTRGSVDMISREMMLDGHVTFGDKSFYRQHVELIYEQGTEPGVFLAFNPTECGTSGMGHPACAMTILRPRGFVSRWSWTTSKTRMPNSSERL